MELLQLSRKVAAHNSNRGLHLNQCLLMDKDPNLHLQLIDDRVLLLFMNGMCEQALSLFRSTFLSDVAKYVQQHETRLRNVHDLLWSRHPTQFAYSFFWGKRERTQSDKRKFRRFVQRLFPWAQESEVIPNLWFICDEKEAEVDPRLKGISNKIILNWTTEADFSLEKEGFLLIQKVRSLCLQKCTPRLEYFNETIDTDFGESEKLNKQLQKTLAAIRANASPFDGTLLVTALFPIREREPPNSNRSCKSPEEYIRLSKPFLEWNVSKLIFTTPELALKVHSSFQTDQYRTWIVPVSMEQLNTWKYVETMLELQKKGRTPAFFNPQKDTPLYAFSQAAKYDCLEYALQLYPEKSHVYWIDFGIHHVAIPMGSGPQQLLTELSKTKRLRCTLLRNLNPEEIKNEESFFGRLQQAVGGGLVGGPRELTQKLISLFKTTFAHTIEDLQRYVLDEAVLASVFLKNPELFFPLWTGHREMLQTRTADQVARCFLHLFQQKDWKGILDFKEEVQWDKSRKDHMYPILHSLIQSNRIAEAKQLYLGCPKLFDLVEDSRLRKVFGLP